MNVDNRSGEWSEMPPASCRDRGWMRGWVGAWCLSCSPDDWCGFREANGSHPHQDRHLAPASSPPFPLSLQDAERLHSPFRSSKFIRTETAFPAITRFGGQTSSGRWRHLLVILRFGGQTSSGIRNAQVKAAFAELFYEGLAGYSQFYGDTAFRSLAARDEACHDGGVPAGGAFHGGEAGSLICVVEEVYDGLLLLTAFETARDDAHNHQVLLAGAGGKLWFQEGVQHVARHYRLTIDDDGLQVDETGVIVGFPLGVVAGPAQGFVL